MMRYATWYHSVTFSKAADHSSMDFFHFFKIVQMEPNRAKDQER